MKALALTALLLLTTLAGCNTPTPEPGSLADFERFRKDGTGRDADGWPRLNGTITILDNGAFADDAFTAAARQFELLTGVEVKREEGEDAGRALNKLTTASPGQYDVIYGIDNALLGRAIRLGVLERYTAQMANRVAPAYRFDTTGYATPVDHGYVAINVDEAGAPGVNTLAEVRAHAEKFVTQDPRTSSPGLAFLLVTVAKYGEEQPGSPGAYSWKSYWRDLFTGRDTDRDQDGDVAGCVLVTPDWTSAYEQHFSGGYGPSNGGAGDYPIVTSYTESPAYEHFYGRERDDLATVVLEDNATWHQIQTMAIVKGTDNRPAAQAWIEFTLTDFFQELAAPHDAVYPVVEGIEVASTYKGVDPSPGSFRPARIQRATIDANLERWLKEWTALYEDTALNCRL
ncbi:MAG: thiamine transport system substrate-binding protein [Thermoplasmata archaeon]|jgi:thiamine transport system substrate-binding protein|nr:thiamine transport system substrate-binding protein [Thermoplasmata archaeon]